MILDCAGKSLDLSEPRVMGVLNVTPDSFSDGGKFQLVDVAIARAHEMVAEGASIIDVGGESTRPGAATVSADEEMQRVMPVVTELARNLSVPVSIDTRKPEVMRAACDAGAGMINDVSGFTDAEAMAVARNSGAAVCIMHMKGVPDSMQKQPEYLDVVVEVREFLDRQAGRCVDAGIDRERILVDPGFGFGKSVEHNLHLLRDLRQFGRTGFPVLVGLSRKSMIGVLLGRSVDERISGSLALAAWAVREGARVVRTHDVSATVDVVRMTWQLMQSSAKADQL